MKLDASQFGWIQKMAGGALGGEATGHSAKPELPPGYVYEYNLTQRTNDIEMVVYRTSANVAKSNVKVEIGRAVLSYGLFVQASHKKDFCEKYMNEVIKNYEAKPDKIADLLPTPEISEDIMAMLELQQMKTKWTPDEKIAVVEAELQDAEQHDNKAQAAYLKAKLSAMEQSYKETQVKAMNQSMSAKITSAKFIAILKAQTPYGNSKNLVPPSASKKSIVELPDDPNDGFSGAGDEQKFLQRIGVMSNLHVDLQGKTIAYKTKEYRLKCSKCGQFTTLARSVAEKFLYEDSDLVGFCKAHRHVVEVSDDTVGRKFRA